MNKGKPASGGNFSNVNFFQSGRQNQNNGRNNLRYQNAGNPNNNNGMIFTNNNLNSIGGNVNRMKTKAKNDTRSSSTKFINRKGNDETTTAVPSTKGGNTNFNNNSDNNTRNKPNFTNNNSGNAHGNSPNRSSRKPNLQKNNLRKTNTIPIKPKLSKAEPERMVNGESNSASESNSFEVKFFGSLIQNPETLGFHKLSHRPQKLPRYMLKENILFDMSSFQTNQWDSENQKMLLRRENEFSGEPQLLFEEFQEYRKVEREQMEKYNLVDKENAKKSLDDAIIFRGSCQDMCPIYERVERVFKNQVSKWEKDPNTGRISRNLAIKTFMRPSGQAPPLPSDVRPPDVLQKTLDHIIDNLLPKLPESQSFIWDRTRSIRQDFTFQNNYSGIESIDCHEKICRIHILSLHIMAGANDPDYQQQQEVEQFNNSLQTLTHMYDDVRSRGGFCPSEPEFRAYELMSKIKDTELDRYLQTLPDYVQTAPIVQRTIMLRNLVTQGMNNLNCYFEFFKIILDRFQTPFLLASLAEIHFNEIRFNALRTMSRSYHSKSKKMPLVTDVSLALGYNDSAQFLETCNLYSLAVFHDDETNLSRVDVTGLKSTFKISQKQPYTKQVDEMINGSSMSAIVRGEIINKDLGLRKPQTLEQIARESFKGSKENSLIVTKIFANNRKVQFTSPSTFTPQVDRPVVSNTNFGTMAMSDATGSGDHRTSTFFKPDETAKPPDHFQQTNLNSCSSMSNQILNDQYKPKPEKLKSSTMNFGVPDTELSTQPGMTKFNKPDVPFSHSTEAVSDPVIRPESQNVPSEVILQHKLVENPLFRLNSAKLTDKIIEECVTSLGANIIEQKIREEKLKRALTSRNQNINKLSEEMFSTFMKEQIYLVSLEARAINYYNKTLKVEMVRRFAQKARKALIEKKANEETSKEIKAFTDMIPVPIVFPKACVTPQKKKIQTSNLSANIVNILDAIQPHSDFEGTIVLRSSTSAASKWILSQLGFKTGDTETVIRSSNGCQLELKFLPDSFEAPKYFEAISTIIIQVGSIEGIDTPERSTLLKCLERDAKVLAKLKFYMENFSSHACFSFVIIYVDVFGINLTYTEINDILHLEDLSSSNVTIGFFRLNSSFLQVNAGLGVLKKLQLDLGKLMTSVWRETYTKERKNDLGSANSLRMVYHSGSELTANSLVAASRGMVSNSEKSTTPSELIKKRMKYLHRVIDDSKTKRRKYTNSLRRYSYLADLSREIGSDFTEDHSKSNVASNSILGSGRDLSGVKGFKKSFSMLRSHQNSNEPSIEGSELIYDNERSRQRLQDISELDQLADSILKN